jgi:hypothetical protein
MGSQEEATAGRNVPRERPEREKRQQAAAPTRRFLVNHNSPTPYVFHNVLILKELKALSFDTLSQVLILKRLRDVF